MDGLKTPERCRFGVFEADFAAGELRRSGIRVKLNAQPLRVLAMLVARPGEVLTRDEIARDLWPDGTFVDYEHGVNSAVNRIREALGDSAGNPRFVETLARKGYRFVAPVERLGEPEVELAAVVQVAPAVSAAAVEAGFSARILTSAEELPQAPHRTVRLLFVLFQLMYAGFYVGALGNLPEIEELLAALPSSGVIFYLMIASAAVMIPVRAFVLSAVFLRPPRARQKVLEIWQWLLLPMDLAWSVAPFLLLHHINFGVALACTSLLVYSPFAQRSLVLMGAVVAEDAR